jgi:hypothetical protein
MSIPVMVPVKGQIFVAEDGRRFAIIKVDDIEPFVIGPKDAADLAEKWSADFGPDSATAQMMTRLAAKLNGNGTVQ